MDRNVNNELLCMLVIYERAIAAQDACQIPLLTPPTCLMFVLEVVMKAKPKSELPTSGRIGRFAQFLIAIGGENAALKIIRGIESYDKVKAPEKAAWWDITMVRMEKTLGREKALEVMQSCGRKCCGAQTRSRAKALYRESSSIADFLTRLNKTGMGGGRLVLVDDHTIRGGYDRCYCGQVAAATKPFASEYLRPVQPYLAGGIFQFDFRQPC